MKVSLAVFSAVTFAEKKVPPRHPLQRLNRLVILSEELLSDWYGFLPSQNAWKSKFSRNAGRMERAFTRGQQRCGYYNGHAPHGGPRERREADDEIRYNRDDPKMGTRQICQGFSKWANRSEL